MIGILIPNNLWFCPYVGIYTNIFDKERVQYEIVSWSRDGKDEMGCIQYTNSKTYSNTISRLLSYFRYSLFVKKTIKHKKYEKLIVFTPQLAIFLAGFLKRNYKGRYIFDYRDLSIEQLRVFNKPFIRVLDNSAVNVISSPGFKKYLPEGYDYVLSHNFNIDKVRQVLMADSTTASTISTECIDVLTIGGIRDFDSNVQVIDALSNIKGFNVRFIGRGPSAEALRAHAEEIGAHNVLFEGYYPKEKEAAYIMGCTFMNIFYPRRPSHDSALSNRFYNSLIYRRPMIVTADTTQGDYVEKYGLGLAIKSCDNLDNQMKSFIKNLSMERYDNNCRQLLSSFLEDYETFREKLVSFMK